VARKRFIEAVKDYNIQVRSFPTNLTAMMFSYTVKASFTVENEKEIAHTPTVDFSAAPAPVPAK
jgi:LemA protein